MNEKTSINSRYPNSGPILQAILLQAVKKLKTE